MAKSELTARDRKASLAATLGECKAEITLWLSEDLLHGRRDRARELVETIERTLAGEPVHLLATIGALESIGVSIHRWTSEEGLPGQLRRLAEDLERSREILDTSLGYREWNQL